MAFSLAALVERIDGLYRALLSEHAWAVSSNGRRFGHRGVSPWKTRP
jgi:hypothetical protein